MADVFISYKRENTEAANAVATHLIAAGYSCWFDNSLVAGQRWDERIRQELRSAKCVVVIWSKDSWASRFVQAEAMEGFDREILIAARLDDVRLEPPFNIVQTADLRTEAGLQSLTSGVMALSGPTDLNAMLDALEYKMWRAEHAATQENPSWVSVFDLRVNLIKLASERRTATYSEVANHLNMDNDTAFRRMLDDAIIEKNGRRAILCALVVDASSGIPGEAFFAKFLPHMPHSERRQAWTDMVADIFDIMSE